MKSFKQLDIPGHDTVWIIDRDRATIEELAEYRVWVKSAARRARGHQPWKTAVWLSEWLEISRLLIERRGY